jgi:hypothetical protein
VLPACNSEAMQLHLDEIATKVAPGAHAILILDQAGWHGAKQLRIPANISLLPLPPRAPELNRAVNDTPAAQTGQSGGNVSVQVVWPRAAGAYEQPSMDLRIKNGNAFAIALPLCPR